MRALLFLSLILPFGATASINTIEPDSYAAGTNLSHVSPYAALELVNGDNVYSRSISTGYSGTAWAMLTTGPLRARVFGHNSPDHFHQWMAPTILNRPYEFDTYSKWSSE